MREIIMAIEVDIRNTIINKDNKIMITKMILEIEIEMKNSKTKEIILNLLKSSETQLQELMIM